MTKKIPTPFFLISKNILKENFIKLKGSFNVPLKIYYSVKTNYEPEVLKTLKSLGSGADAISSYELMILKKIKFDPKQVCLDSVYKPNSLLKEAVKWGVNIINIETIDELQRLNEIAKRYNKTCDVSFRMSIKPKLIDWHDKFGIDEEKFGEYYDMAQGLSNVNPVGIFSHIGSQITDPAVYLELLDKLFSISKGFDIKEINIGGGMPSPSIVTGLTNILKMYLGLDVKPDKVHLEDFGKQISEKFDKLAHKDQYLAIQSGRAISGSCGFLVSRVVLVRRNWAFLDTSKYSLGGFITTQHQMIVANKSNEKPTQIYNLSGISADAGDVFSLNRKMPYLEQGDTIVILDAGAYSISKATQFTVLNPPVYFLTNGKLRLIRRRGTYVDIRSPLRF